MREFTPPSFPIYMYDKDGEYKVVTIGDVSIFSLLFALCASLLITCL
jgi:cytidine deaminase